MSEQKQTGKLALVTGGSRGIGRAICTLLARKGMTVCFTYLSNSSRAGETLKELKEISDKPHAAWPCDMADIHAVKHFFTNLKKEYGLVDVLVNNAGILGEKKFFLMTSDEDWWEVMNTNMRSVTHSTRMVLGGMVARRSGTIINIASLSAKGGTPGSSAYSASKAAIIAFSKSLYREVGHSGVKIFTVSPGVIETDMTVAATDAFLNSRLGNSPLKRLGRPDEVAELVGYLANGAPALMAGQDIGIDGMQ